MWKSGQSNDKKFENPPAGTYGAVCIKVIDLGTQPVVWEGDTKYQRKVFIQWELDEQMEDKRPFVTGRKFTVSMHEKATLRAFLKGWRGRDFTEEEMRGFNPMKLIGAPCMLSLVQAGDYVNVASAAKLPKGMGPLKPTNPTVYFSLDDFDEKIYAGLSKKMQEDISNSPEFKGLKGNQSGHGFEDMEDDIPGAESTDIPF
jgi:hypothetical protein